MSVRRLEQPEISRLVLRHPGTFWPPSSWINQGSQTTNDLTRTYCTRGSKRRINVDFRDSEVDMAALLSIQALYLLKSPLEG